MAEAHTHFIACWLFCMVRKGDQKKKKLSTATEELDVFLCNLLLLGTVRSTALFGKKVWLVVF